MTAQGNVAEVLAPIAFRIDKDGIGGEAARPRFQDEEFGDRDLVNEGVLVLDVRETAVKAGAPVQVVGTVRQFDLAEAERVFDVDLDDRLYGPFHEQLVVVADSVKQLPRAQGTTPTSTTTTTTERDARRAVQPPLNSLVGLEVTARGDVTEVVGSRALRLDKDGVGDRRQAVEFDDEDFGDVEPARLNVVVISPNRIDVGSGTGVEVTGTVRQFELAEVERLFNLDLDQRPFEPFEGELVIVADKVTPLPPPSGGGTTTTTRGQ